MITLSKIIPLSFLSIGIFLLIQVLMPIISFQLWYFGQKYNEIPLISPKHQGQQVPGISIQNKDNFPAFISDLKRETIPPFSKFSLSVPKLNVNNMNVWVDSNDLSKGLTHLPGSALPGEKGNVFISGHSALNPLFSFKSAVFAKLSDLKKGDEILVLVQGIKYKYRIIELKIVDPKDESVINPPDTQGRFISLMTCVPPGLNFKRLVVLGKMV